MGRISALFSGIGVLGVSAIHEVCGSGIILVTFFIIAASAAGVAWVEAGNFIVSVETALVASSDASSASV